MLARRPLEPRIGVESDETDLKLGAEYGQWKREDVADFLQR